MAKKSIFQTIFCKFFRRKYEIVTISNCPFAAPNVRIIALRDIPRYGIKKGTVGGSVSSYHNLSQFGDCWVGENGVVRGKARVSGSAIVRSRAKVHGNAKIKGRAIIYGQAEVYDDALVKDAAEVYGQAKVFGHAKIRGRTFVHSDANVYGRCKSSGRTTIRGNAQVYAKSTVTDSDISGTAVICGNAHVVDKTICNKTIYC